MKTFDAMPLFNFFEKGDIIDGWQFYDVKPGYAAFWKHEEVTSFVMLTDGKAQFALETKERGRIDTTATSITNLDIYELKKVY